jgi:hypothetical protein
MNKLFCGKELSRFVLLIALIVSSNILANSATQIDITGPGGSGAFGASVAILPNGNIVVADPTFDISSPRMISDVGAVYLYDGKSRNLISRITGNCQNDNLGSNGIKVLNTGNFLISSPNLDLITSTSTHTNNCISGSQQFVVRDVGAVTTGNSQMEASILVTSSNSLTGINSNDRVSSGGIVVLPNGNYVVVSPFWNDNRGAVTFGTSHNPRVGAVSVSNSLTGSNYNDLIGNITVLANNNFVVNSSTNRGSATLCSGVSGCAGLVSASNSLIGSDGDSVSSDGVTALPNGNYVVRSRFWNGQRGAVTFGNGETGVVGQVSSSNSLVGSAANDFVGSGDGFLNSGITVLNNGNYVVISSNWDNGAVANAGAATFGNGSTGVSGVISSTNSLIGRNSSDFYIAKTTALSNGNYVLFLPRWNAPQGTPGGAAVFGNGVSGVTGYISTSNSLTNVNESGGVTALTNGNYVVASPNWNGTLGAVTFGNGITGTVGTVSAINSLVGTNDYDSIGSSGVTALSNGNYVVNSSGWNNQRGASTFCNGTNGCIGIVSEATSLVGSNSFDRVGGGGSIALTNGNYVVRSFYWNNYRGAATFGNGTNGLTGSVSDSNSLIGTNANDSIGNLSIISMPNGNYIVVSRGWNESRGAVTWGNGTVGINGEVTSANSLVGSTPGDQVGFIGNTANGVTVFGSGAYAVRSDYWDNGSTVDAGAISLSKRNSPLVGTISLTNSVRGTAQYGGFRMNFAYSLSAKNLVVGHPNNYVSIFSYNEFQTPFDYDGDGKSDISVFRPENGVWHLQQSQSGYAASGFGISIDKLVPADYDGDGKTDLAVFRENPSDPGKANFYILQSSNNQFRDKQFGATGDIPVAGDWDGDGKADVGVYRAGTQANLQGYFFYQPSSQPATNFVAIAWGTFGDKPVVADFDGDGRTDAAVFRPSNGVWYIQRSRDGFYAVAFGAPEDKPVVGDYDGDGKADIAVFRPSNGVWYQLRSRDGFAAAQFGISTDKAVPADYDGDGKTDLAVYRDGNWYFLNSTNGFAAFGFGTATDKPVPNSFVH